MRNLQRGRSLAWGRLIPAFEHAIHLAMEAEYQANYASNQAQCGVDPAYPPLVLLLADAGELVQP
jgi:hypothetical protein